MDLVIKVTKETLITDVLKAYKNGNIGLADARKRIINATTATLTTIDMENKLRMCQFSGGSDGVAKRKCSRSDSGPMNCYTCRVAADWDNAY